MVSKRTRDTITDIASDRDIDRIIQLYTFAKSSGVRNDKLVDAWVSPYSFHLVQIVGAMSCNRAWMMNKEKKTDHVRVISHPIMLY